MAIPVAEKLLATAQSGEKKLTTGERRHVVGFIMATQPDVTNTQMAEWFQVTERTVRLDKRAIREEKAKRIKEDDVGLIVADIIMEYERQVNDLEKGKKKAVPGTRVFLDYCSAIMEIRLKTTKALQDLGYLPKNLGNMVVEKFYYKAVVHKDGGVEVRRVDLHDEKALPKADETGAAERAALDAEFGTGGPPKLLPAVVVSAQDVTKGSADADTTS